MFAKILKSEKAMIIISIILGLGLSAIFRNTCNGRNCIIYKAPKPNDIQGHIFKHDDTCYTFSSHSKTCPINEEKIINM